MDVGGDALSVSCDASQKALRHLYFLPTLKLYNTPSSTMSTLVIKGDVKETQSSYLLKTTVGPNGHSWKKLLDFLHLLCGEFENDAYALFAVTDPPFSPFEQVAPTQTFI